MRYEDNELLQDHKRELVDELLQLYRYGCTSEEVMEQTLRFTQDVIQKIMHEVTVVVEDNLYDEVGTNEFNAGYQAAIDMINREYIVIKKN